MWKRYDERKPQLDFLRTMERSYKFFLVRSGDGADGVGKRLKETDRYK